MKKHYRDLGQSRAFTLIELLVVISIIGILAGLILPALGKAKVRAQVARASTEISGLVGAINSYNNDYSRYPTSPETRKRGQQDEYPDFTFGTFNSPPDNWFIDKRGQPLYRVGREKDHRRNNSEVMAILMGYKSFNEREKPNPENPKKTQYLDPKATDDVKQGGLDPRLVYRDPWGNPYIVTLDLNYDNQCRDSVYMEEGISRDMSDSSGKKGFNGLFRVSPDNPVYEARVPVMVWSLGPDAKVDPAQKADKGVNKDNILSWK